MAIQISTKWGNNRFGKVRPYHGRHEYRGRHIKKEKPIKRRNIPQHFTLDHFLLCQDQQQDGQIKRQILDCKFSTKTKPRQESGNPTNRVAS